MIKQPTLRKTQGKGSRLTPCFCHNPIFTLFSSVAIQREQRKNQEQGNIHKDLSVRSCAEREREREREREKERESECVCVCVHSVRA